MPQANAEDRPASDQLPQHLDRVRHSLRIPRTVRQEYPIGLEGFNLRRGGRGRNDGHIAPCVDEPAKNVLFHPKIVGDNMPPSGATGPWLIVERGRSFTRSFRPSIGLL